MCHLNFSNTLRWKSKGKQKENKIAYDNPSAYKDECVERSSFVWTGGRQFTFFFIADKPLDR